MHSRVGYAVLRPAVAATEDERGRVLMIMDSADEAEDVAAALRDRGLAVEIRQAVGSGPTVRLGNR